MSNDDYSRFYVPPVRGVDARPEDDEQYQTPRVRQLAPFLYRGDGAWPFKWQIKGEKE